jgi:general secretion pathway protein N
MTGVLAATCLWAVTVLALAIAGLGGRIAPLQGNPEVPPIPAVKLTTVTPRLGQAGEYAEVGERPLLIADRRPVAVGPVTGEGTTEIDVALTSVLITPRLQMAILTDNQGGASRRVRVGDNVAGTSWRLVSVAPRSATLEGPGGQRTLELRVFNGQGAGQVMQPVAAEEAAGQQPNPEEAPDPNAAGPQPMPAPVAMPAPNAAPAENLTQEQQIEAIRRRIEARRAQMRAEAGKQADDKR